MESKVLLKEKFSEKIGENASMNFQNMGSLNSFFNQYSKKLNKIQSYKSKKIGSFKIKKLTSGPKNVY